MTCDVCGKPAGGMQFTAHREGDASARYYCEPCFTRAFGEAPEVQAMIRETKARRPPLLLAELEKDRAKIQTAFGPKFAELCAANPRFTTEACEHIYLAGVFAARRDSIFRRQCGRHLTGREMTEACADYAREAFGNSAKERMKNWGLGNSSDIGDLVFLLVEKGLLHADSGDQRSDFDGLPFLEDNEQPDKI